MGVGLNHAYFSKGDSMVEELTTSFNESIENAIQTFIEQKFQSGGLKQEFPNLLLRQDVLNLLDRYCTVVYYPLEDESNNGFRLKDVPFLDGETHDFVFINTAQTLEKQAFTAAHELGHIWGVDEAIVHECQLDDTAENREGVINRFAAVLLMPRDLFRTAVKVKAAEYLEEGKQAITLINLVKVTVHLMNYFYAPWKAVVIRMNELQQIDDNTTDRMLDQSDDLGKEIKNFSERYIAECGYVDLQSVFPKKMIDGLPEMLERAEKCGAVPQKKIDRLRAAFDIKKTEESSTEMDGVFSLDTQEG